MGKAKPFLFGGLLGASTMFVAMQYHVIRSHDGFQLVPRTPQHSVGLAYADIRNWNASQWTDRPELARALMAHGSADLISQSVAENLADTVSTESATLDQLRSFLNKPVQALDIPDTGRSNTAESRTSTEEGSGRSSDEQPFAIPFPRETKKSSQRTTTVRVTQGEEDDSSPDSTSRESRFSSEDITEAESRDRSSSSTAAAPLPRPGQQPARKESAARPSAPASSPFEEVTTDLESRARMALSRAQSTLNEPEAGTSGSDPTDDAAESGFSRSQIQQRLKSEIESAGGFGDSLPRSTSSSRDSDVRAPERAGTDVDSNFDPFIE